MGFLSLGADPSLRGAIMGSEKYRYQQLEAEGLLVWILAGGLGASLVFSLIAVPIQCFHLHRGYGVALIFLYVLFLVIALLTEFGVIKLQNS
ncbi:unnamed protein product [Ranitomeya imitator]|uniref:Sodium/calcium exchanger membrane region domain-containing protein n=1 Tax=Ranitomeya imitator TaxID=111125 RepID=A0ABN9LY22_9NEOB|nr:unnamed protein product [Ranitomeya imitator]